MLRSGTAAIRCTTCLPHVRQLTTLSSAIRGDRTPGFRQVKWPLATPLGGRSRRTEGAASFRSSAVAASSKAECMPHSHISATKDSEVFTLRLLDRLWEKYRERVSYVRTYEEVVKSQKATFVNDHIAFRSIALQEPSCGIASVSRVFEALGYRPAATYTFEDKHLNAIHYEHPRPIFPKLFISELKAWELSEASQAAITSSLSSLNPLHVPQSLLSSLHAIGQNTLPPSEDALEAAAAAILTLPWDVPQEEAVKTLHQESQYGAWVLVHGYNVNHFTALINSHGPTTTIQSIESTVEALQAEGVPMKSQIEGDTGGKLRQTATQAVNMPIAMARGNKVVEVDWPYAYFELAQRDPYTDHDGQLTRFEGFLSANATHLFDITQGAPK
eukprot:CAMPEP_0181316212 /NCGR_PEP_ID=MMETSP1101-20121128/15777_1 /TAXON_ID=46948 /ORGANISM="Rhodomonas abbreviata, Strain Caron Lab Isolate" /LENGTH=386 /DNA_ID=CAMNT_0023423449 /DNA_START=100 /DNA_END=1260 /DNA_ORIENTATION=-